MKAFLNKTAEYLLEKYKDNISDLCIVLPSRRAGIFLKKYFSTHINKNIWLPQIYSIDDFINKLSDNKPINNTFLLFELYQIHKNIEKKQAQSFDDFIKWGQILLHDFNETDLYMADPKQLFSYIDEARAISLWNPDNKPLTDFEKNYLKFFNSLIKYYKNFRTGLIDKNATYQGLTYRLLAENIEERTENLEWEKIIFTGFNALTKSEETIIKYLIKTDKAEILWDADKYYLNNTNSLNNKKNKVKHEAGTFLRRYFNTWAAKDINWIEDNFKNENKNISVIGIPKNIGQAKVAGNIIAENNINIDNLALVLADEKLLLPVLNSLPENINYFNVTMGLPINYTPVFNLYDFIFNLHENAIKFSKNLKEDKLIFHHDDILKIFQHPNIISLFSGDKSDISSLHQLTKKIYISNKTFFSLTEIDDILKESTENISETFNAIFINIKQNPELIFECLIKITEKARDNIIEKYSGTNENEYYKVELEYFYNFSIIIKQLKDLLKEYKIEISLQSIRKIFNQTVRTTNIPFYGEPLKGIQIMGMLETRTLDFENLILLSANEGFIPSSKNQNSFIYYDIRKKFGLPTYKDKEAIYAYHFYRMIQRSKNIFLLYNTETDGINSSDKSRFISQLLYELPKYNPNTNFDIKLLNTPTYKNKKPEIIIEKNKNIYKLLLQKAKKGFSPSSLNTYINCPLQFYFQEIEKIREEEKTESTIKPSTFGTVIHEVLHKLFEPFIDKVLTIEDIKSMHSNYKKILNKSFKDNYKDGNISIGKNLLSVEVANNFIKSFLNKEAELINEIQKNGQDLVIKKLEEKFKSFIIIFSNDKKIDVNIKGFVDRIDIIGNTIRIIDYKTGAMKQKELRFNDRDSLLNESKFSKAFQILMYLYLYLKTTNHDKNLNIECGIISLLKIKSGFIKLTPPKNESSENFYDIFNDVLTKLLEEIFDVNTPFMQTKKIENCNYCIYKNICNR
ncbi:MAG: PD-(D/E)XK nuclease family protein [Bacteroidales bacterium]|nr:PD-(D/E)XK nuclease family protein [Bacteroidales bacterium]